MIDEYKATIGTEKVVCIVNVDEESILAFLGHISVLGGYYYYHVLGDEPEGPYKEYTDALWCLCFDYYTM